MNHLAPNRTPDKPSRAVTTKGFSEALLQRIKRQARKQGRSMNEQILRTLADAHR